MNSAFALLIRGMSSYFILATMRRIYQRIEMFQQTSAALCQLLLRETQLCQLDMVKSSMQPGNEVAGMVKNQLN